MPGKQVRIDPELYNELQTKASDHGLSIGQYIERMQAELEQYHSLMGDLGLDLQQGQDRLVRLSISTWSRLNVARAMYILDHPENSGTIDDVIIYLIEGQGHECQVGALVERST